MGTPGPGGVGRNATAGPHGAAPGAGGTGAGSRKAGSRTLDKLWVGARDEGAGYFPLSETPTAGAQIVASGRTRPYTDKEMRLIYLFRRAHDKNAQVKSEGERQANERPTTGASRPGTGASRPGTGLSRPGTGASRPGTAGLSRPGTGASRPGTAGLSRPGTANTLRERRLEAARLGEKAPSLDEVRMGFQGMMGGSGERPESGSTDVTVTVDEAVLRILGLSPRESIPDASAGSVRGDSGGGGGGSSSKEPALPSIPEAEAEVCSADPGGEEDIDVVSVATSDEWRGWDQPEVLNLENFPDSQLPLGVLEQELREQLRTASGEDGRPADEDLMPKVEIDVGAWKLLHPPADMSMPLESDP